MKKIYVFGNPIVKKDCLPLKLLPELEKRFPDIEFVVADPSETLNPSDDQWWILDSAEGIDDVVVLQDLSQIEIPKRFSAHDYDLSLDLKLLEKLGRLGKLKIIAIPQAMAEKEALLAVEKALGSLND